jgi:polar amino acid transport system substrate-binding protein
MTTMRCSMVSLMAIGVALCAACSSTATAPTQELRRVLAPTGKLRVGVYQGSPTSIVGDAASGNAKGVGFDLGKELARRAGVPFEPVVYSKNADVLAAVKSGAVDMSFTNATPARMKDMDFSPAMVEVEQGYLVPRGSAIAGVSDVDRAGIRVGVSEGSTSEATLSRGFKKAMLVRAPTLKAAVEMLAGGQLDAFATNKAILYEMSDALPGSRVLDGRWGLEHFGIAIPKGRQTAMTYINTFAVDAKAEGLVTRAVERAGLRGTVRTESH